MILYLTHGNGEESIPLELPASSSQVEEIDIRLDDICSGEGNFRISDVKSSVKGIWQLIRSADLLDPEDLEKLNRLSRQIDAMSERERQIFAGALLSECISNLDDVLQTVGRIGQYGMIPEVTCDRELGGYLVEHKEHAEADRRIRDAAGMLENAVPHIAEWDESAIRQLVAQVKVLSKNEISVTLKSGIEICQSISN